MKRIFIVFFTIVSFAVVARAEDNTITTISGTTSNNAGASYTVGSSGTNNVLTISSGGQLTNVDRGYVGDAASASNNAALVTGLSSLWLCTNGFYVGNNGSGNRLTIASGGVVSNASGNIGANGVSAGSNTVLVTGAGSVWQNGSDLTVGGNGLGNSLTVSNGGVVFNVNGTIGNAASASNNAVLVTGAGSVWQNSGQLYISYSGSSNSLTIANGGVVSNTVGYIGRAAYSSNNAVLVTGAGSLWQNSSDLNVGYHYTNSGNSLMITGGGVVRNVNGIIGSLAGANNDAALVTGAGSVWQNSGYLCVGDSGWGNSLTIAGGAAVSNTTGRIGYTAASASNNTVLVTGAGSLWQNSSDLYVGNNGWGNSLTVANGGVVSNANAYVGNINSASNNVVLVTGAGSLWQNSANIYVGNLGSGERLTISNGGWVVGTTVRMGGGSAGASNNTLQILSGGLLEANTLLNVGTNSSITNFGGIFQFSAAAPTITPNGAVGGSIVLTNGVISYRNVGAANIANSQVANITFQGQNAFRLDNSTNVSAAYAFATNNGGLYQDLQLINARPTWQGSLTVGAGGTLLVSNATAATVANAFTNQGAVRVIGSQVTYGGPVVIGGSYVSDPSTNIFTSNVTVTASGSLSGSNGDLFVFYRDFYNGSQDRSNFNLAFAGVLLTNGAGVSTHTLNLTNSLALDMGAVGMHAAQLATNFSIGTLSISLSNNVILTGVKSGAATNALYVGWLDLSAWNTNAGSLNSTLLAALTLPDINLYYDASDARNAYLQDASYALWGGGGLLIPIPEPSSLALLLLGPAWILVRCRLRGARGHVG